MSRHEGVSCDSCLKGNFRGKRYKCLICYDYDLCATCYEAGATTTRHTTDHPMQCILTRSDFDLYYGGEAVSIEHPQSFTCPFCGRMGLTESTLQEHVTAEHSDSSVEIVCPVCAAQPGGEPNHMTDDFSAHLALDHRNPRDLDEPSGSRHVRRIPHPGRGMNSARARRSQMQFSTSSGLASLSPSSRESMDPIAELLSQLSSVRRSNLAQSNTTSQLQQLQMQLQMERQQAQVARQQLERLPRRQATTTSIATSSATSATGANNTSQQSQYTVVLEPSPSPSSSSSVSQFLLSRCTEPVITEGDQQALETEHADRSLFVQELLLNTLADQFICEEWDNLTKIVGLTSDSEESPTQRHSISSFNSDDVANHLAPFMGQISAITQEQQNISVQQQSSQNQEADDQQTWNVNSSTCRSSGAVASGRQSNRNANNVSHGSSVPAGRGGVNMQRTASREGLSRQIGRTTSREGGTSPSSNRRKALRQVDDRNKTTEPPPPH